MNILKYNKIIFASIFHISSYFISLSIIYLTIILTTEHNGIFNSIKHVLEPLIYKYIKLNSNVCENYYNNKTLFNKITQPLSYSSFVHNQNLLLMLIALIIAFIIITFISFKVLKISSINNLSYYIIDLLLIVFSIGCVEFLFFKLIGSKYYSFV